MATLGQSDRERRQKKKRMAKGSAFAVFLLKMVLATVPVVTKLVQLAILIKDLFR